MLLIIRNVTLNCPGKIYSLICAGSELCYVYTQEGDCKNVKEPSNTTFWDPSMGTAFKSPWFSLDNTLNAKSKQQYKKRKNHRRFFSLLNSIQSYHFKGTVTWDFWALFWAVWMYLGLNVNRLWLLNFNDAPLILDNYFKFWRVSG